MQPPKDAYTNDNAQFIADMLEQSGTVSVRIRKPLHDRVKALCENSNVSVNDYVSAAVAMRLFWEEQEKK
ncbi:hypothetical protein XBP1_1520002 [Xenorhabdus bovienii str. puntauvense]|uniref:Uncharacterized protein n=1 Tax=Xenorhabdus bovienii str. puntauvense TaxID=1398201 RepID=A0A077NBW4_XENBV|nr:toxin-antitoxin system HicB family antitoxin [Xenorhabdus bovienii]CDG95733.1 hypothetical protein XBP1_1520002 [Xenorhabdus bovienii str. puntauvense]